MHCRGDYKTMFLFSHRTVSGGILYGKEYYMKLLSGEKGVAHPLNGWEIVDCYILEKWNDDNSLSTFHFFHAAPVGLGFSLFPWTLAHKVCHTHQMIYLFMIPLISFQMNEFMIHSPYPILSLTLIKDRYDRL